MIQGFYITSEDCQGYPIAPDTGYNGIIPKGIPIALTYFDEYGCEFIDDDHGVFRLDRPCPVVSACSCDICGKIVATADIELHKTTDDNCKNIKKSLDSPQ